MVTDQLADMLTRIRNAAMAGHPTVEMPASKTKARVLELFVDQGYIARVEPVQGASNKPVLKVYLRYDERGHPVIRELKRLSSPGKRVYVGKESIPQVRGGLGMVVVSTSKGIMSDALARKEGVGGELLCSVF